MNRRSFLSALISQTTLLSIAGKADASNFITEWFGEEVTKSCVPMTCFSDDYFALDYSEYYSGLFKRAQQGGYEGKNATGDILRPVAHELFHDKRLYAPIVSTIRSNDLTNNDYFALKRIDFDLECGVSVRGCLSIPKKRAKGLIYLAHGSSTTPERCFNESDPDYMNAIGAKLSRAGFAVWCPFVPHAGNSPSVYNLAALFASRDINFINILCSSLNAGTSIYASLGGDSNISIGQYGVSGGVYTSLYLLAARGALWPSVMTGDFGDEKAWLSSDYIATNAGTYLPGVMWMMSGIGPFLIPHIAPLIWPAPIYFEYGTQNDSGAELVVVEEFRKVYQLKGSPGSLIASERFKGGHEVKGDDSVLWLVDKIK